VCEIRAEIFLGGENTPPVYTDRFEPRENPTKFITWIGSWIYTDPENSVLWSPISTIHRWFMMVWSSQISALSKLPFNMTVVAVQRRDLWRPYTDSSDRQHDIQVALFLVSCWPRLNSQPLHWKCLPHFHYHYHWNKNRLLLTNSDYLLHWIHSNIEDTYLLPCHI